MPSQLKEKIVLSTLNSLSRTGATNSLIYVLDFEPYFVFLVEKDY